MHDFLFEQRFQQAWEKQFPQCQPANTRLLIGISGGVDSIVLATVLRKLGFPIRLAHANFQLRGEESERDEHFVRAFAERKQLPFFVTCFNTPEVMLAEKMGVQEAARKLRYEWFEELRQQWDAAPGVTGKSYIVTAHHADDNIETLLLHFFRGTGIAGLTGIQPLLEQQRLLRPLLLFRKVELLEYAKQACIAFVDDSSNASDDYTRNYFRNRLLPKLQEIFPQVDQRLLDNIKRFGQVEQIYRDAVQQQLRKLLVLKGNEVHIPVEKWKKLSPLDTYTWEIIQPYGFHAAQVPEIIRLLHTDAPGFQMSPSHRLLRNRNWMIITPVQKEQSGYVQLQQTDTDTVFPEGHLSLTVHPKEKTSITTDTNTAFLDADEIEYPLLLRRWKQGDYFYPLGMDKKKKISRFLIDQKCSLAEKEKVWVLESAGRIIWVIGYRIHHRLRVTDSTKRVLEIIYRK
jgi:tRNA(Ile)-lysidine synthase